MVIGPVDFDDFLKIMDVHETLRTLMFREQIVLSEVPREGTIEPKPLFLNGLSDAEQSCLEGDFEGSPRKKIMKLHAFNFPFYSLRILIIPVSMRGRNYVLC